MPSPITLSRTKAGCTSRRGTRRPSSWGTPAMLRGGKVGSSLPPGTTGNFLMRSLGREYRGSRGRGEFQVGFCSVIVGLLFNQVGANLFLFSDQRCNELPTLLAFEQEFYDQISKSVAERGRYKVPMIFQTKAFGRIFSSPGPTESGSEGDHPQPSSTSGKAGESRSSRGELPQDGQPSDDSIEYIGTVRKELRRVAPHIPDLTLLRWSGGKIRDPVLELCSALGSSSVSTSESWSDSELSPELRSDGIFPCSFLIIFYV